MVEGGSYDDSYTWTECSSFDEDLLKKRLIELEDRENEITRIGELVYLKRKEFISSIDYKTQSLESMIETFIKENFPDYVDDDIDGYREQLFYGIKEGILIENENDLI